jgi:hypothetical protein
MTNKEYHKKHPFSESEVLFATKHDKDKILQPLFAEIGMKCIAASVDTDQFGTFSGEVERVGNVRETLRKKINTCLEMNPEAEYIIASEGSFGPHPLLGFMSTDLESLLFYQVESKVEIYAEYLDTRPVHAEKVMTAGEELDSFLKEIGFPEQAVIVHPENSLAPIYKGIDDKKTLMRVLPEVFKESKTGKAKIVTDLRACFNPQRRVAILEAGKKLLEKLTSFCPACHSPGFAIVRGIPGLVCSDCGEPTRAARAVLWKCVQCTHEEERERPDGKKYVDPYECEFCNP